MTLLESTNSILGNNLVYTHTLTDDMKAWTDPNANYFCISDFNNPRTSTSSIAQTSSKSDLEATNAQINDSDVGFEDINIETHCEHHMVPILGVAHVAYLPRDKVVGISKLARVIDIFAKRLQTQETMTMQILETIDQALDPLGTAIMIDAKHQCMTTRGISKPNVSTVTTKFSGLFAEDSELRQRFMGLTQAKG